MTPNEEMLREQLVNALYGGQAHVDVLSALKDFPPRFFGTKPESSPHSAWELLEHTRIALHDLWEFSTNHNYVERKWPEDYWPQSAKPSSEEEWHASVRALESDLDAFKKLLNDPQSNLYAPVPRGNEDQTLLREVLLAATHTSYHVGELVFLRRLLGAW